MIAKIGKSAASAATPLFYNEQKVQEGVATVLAINNILTSEIDATLVAIEDKLNTFRYYENINKRTQQLGFHVSLNPKRNEEISDEKLSLIADDYMRSMGYENQPYIVYKHNDIDRTHIHIVSTRVDSEGNKISDSHEFSKSWKCVKELVRKYDLDPIGSESLTKKERFEQRKNEAKEKVKYLQLDEINYISSEDSDKKKKLKNIISFAKEMKCTSITEFKTVLNHFNADVKIVEGEAPKGRKYRGLLFSVFNPNAESILNYGIKGSSIERGLNIEKLEKLFLQNKELASSKVFSKKYVTKEVEQILKKYKYLDLVTLKNQLKQSNIELIIHENKEGRIYGVNFIDTLNRAILKGSEVGLSANKLNQVVNSEENSHTKKEVFELRKIIYAEYNKLKKGKYFFESNFIENLDKYTSLLYDNVQKRTPTLDKEILSSELQNVILLKQDSLKELIDKENGYLLTEAQQYLNVLQYVNHSKEDKMQFLAACNVNLIQNENNYSIVIGNDKKERIVQLNASPEYLGFNISQEVVKSNKGIFFTKEEKQILKSIDNLGEVKFKGISDDLNIFKFLNPQTKTEIQHQMISQFVEENKTDIDKLYENGILVHPIGNGKYVYMYYKNEEIKIPINEEIINEIGDKELRIKSKEQRLSTFEGKDKHVQQLYDQMVQLERVKNNNNDKKLDLIVNGLFYKNKKLHYELKKEILKLETIEDKVELAKLYIKKLPQMKKGKKL